MARSLLYKWFPVVILAPAALFIGMLSAQTDRYQPAIPQDLVRLVNKGRDLRTQGQFDRSIALLDSVLKKRPDYYLAFYNRTLALAEKCGKNADSEAIAAVTASFDTCIALMMRYSIPDPSIYNSKGWFLMMQSSYPAAEASFQLALKKVDFLPETGKIKLYNNIGVLYLYWGKYENARKYLTIASDKYGSELAKDNLKTLNGLSKSKW